MDTDPLALIIAEAAAGTYDKRMLEQAAESIATDARAAEPLMPSDPETAAYVDYWFDSAAATRLGQLARLISAASPPLLAPLWCAFSRLIITKDLGASRARDVSHSRPHRVREVTTIDPVSLFASSARLVSRRAGQRVESTSFRILRADSRDIPLDDNSVDAVMSSPPYLTAIDYLRGHRMSLVWMGYTLSELRRLRSTNIGAERAPEGDTDRELERLTQVARLPHRSQRILLRYAGDLSRFAAEAIRVVRPGGKITLVVGDAALNGVPVPLANLTTSVFGTLGCAESSRIARSIPRDRRYLPPPESALSSLGGRMKQETILTFHTSAA